jgi:hypothetical protein
VVTPAHPDDIRQGLAAAAQRLTEARTAQRAVLLEVAAWLAAAYEIRDSGLLTFTEAIAIAGVSRRTAYQLLPANARAATTKETP